MTTSAKARGRRVAGDPLHSRYKWSPVVLTVADARILNHNKQNVHNIYPLKVTNNLLNTVYSLTIFVIYYL